MKYIYTITSHDAKTGAAQVQYTPAKQTLPVLLREVGMLGIHGTPEMAIAVAKMAPYPEWIALDPSITATPVDAPFVVDPSRQPPV